ncbi:hypothetical protein APS56_10340 [Pseudalgibacter alginicilyticus]|uniref:Lipoprotein n=1 Tax=Pseudalgibacter alginicilyticus TaxID=1736674 RepID=A0A0P0CH30_9FLAO|nr:hypothetical protein [Pseudalgibacter alginicilyticus]ALJ05492.1 hypothetical protein APS56_10340 [Pseudalgibacter alginicilyticus]
MKKSFPIIFLFIVCFSLVAFQCEDNNDTSKTQEEERKELSNLKTNIETLANASICDETTECKYIALGSKPCGGPWSYLIYSTSINVDELENLVKDYNKKEAAFNTKWGVFSDCAFVLPPSKVNCENNSCLPIY